VVRPGTDPMDRPDRYYQPMAAWARPSLPWHQERCPLRNGPPSRVLLGKTDRSPEAIAALIDRGGSVKANIARFTVALSLLATVALTLGAGLKW